MQALAELSNDYDHCQKEIMVGGENLMNAARLISDVAATTAGGVIDSRVADLFWGELRKGLPSHLMGNYLTRLTDQVS